MGAEVGRFERSVFLFLALFCQAFCFVFWDSKFFGVFETYRLRKRTYYRHLLGCSYYRQSMLTAK